jgi:hypothetical protein
MHGGDEELIKVLVGKPKREISLGRLRVGGRITLKWILEEHDEVVWPGLIWLRIGTSSGLL